MSNMTETATVKHTIRWWVYAGSERIPRTATMRGAWGYDATCSCGWDSRTGGAVKSDVDRKVNSHKWEAANGFLSEGR